jgi:hypothetical protein
VETDCGEITAISVAMGRSVEVEIKAADARWA